MTENSIQYEIDELCTHIKVVMKKLEKLEKIDLLESRRFENKIANALTQYKSLNNIIVISNDDTIKKEAEIIKSQTNKKKKIKDLIKKEEVKYDTNVLCEHISYCMSLLTKLERKNIVLSRKLARSIINTLMNYEFFKSMKFSMIEDNLLEDMQTLLYMQEQAKLTLKKGDKNVKEK